MQDFLELIWTGEDVASIWNLNVTRVVWWLKEDFQMLQLWTNMLQRLEGVGHSSKLVNLLMENSWFWRWESVWRGYRWHRRWLWLPSWWWLCSRSSQSWWWSMENGDTPASANWVVWNLNQLEHSWWCAGWPTQICWKKSFWILRLKNCSMFNRIFWENVLYRIFDGLVQGMSSTHVVGG